MNKTKASVLSIITALLLVVIIFAAAGSAAAKNSQGKDPSAASVQEVNNDIVFLTGPQEGLPLEIAQSYIDENRESLGLSENDMADVLVTDQYLSQHTGTTHIYIRQRYQGIEIINANININIAADGSVINMGGSFIGNLEGAVNSTTPEIMPSEAVLAAAGSVGLSIDEPLLQENAVNSGDGGYLFSRAGVSNEPIPVNLVYEEVDGEVFLAWNVEIEESSGDHWWSTRVDAQTGEILSQYDRVVNDNWGTVAATSNEVGYAEAASMEAGTTGPIEPELFDLESLDLAAVAELTGTYMVYALPDESPIHSTGRTLAATPADAAASPYGWHDTDGAVGPEYTVTRGNNAYAYTDLNDDNNPDTGSAPDGGSGLVFNFTLNLAQDPSQYRPAAVTNLFYWNNVMHDVNYLYGFDEAAGNFQENNYGNGGSGSDSVNAEAQDGASVGKKNNANFGTPSDGGNPRMQMFIWDLTTPNRDGDLDNGIIAHEYGHGISNRLVGGPSNVSCLFNNEQMGEGWSDWQSVIMTLKTGDTGTAGKGVGTYALGQSPNGTGIRPAPYSTDFSINGYTYGNLTNVEISIPHGVGFIWNTMLWEMLWNLIEVHGFNPDVYGGWQSGGNNLAHQLVTDGMKLTQCSPGFVNARDAILSADLVLTGGENKCTIWESFARRGLGYSASQGSASSRGDEVEAFDLPAECGPDIQVTPDSIQSTVYTDSVQLEEINIQNNGLADLDWNLQETAASLLQLGEYSESLFAEMASNLTLVLDDGNSEQSIGGDPIGQFVWLNRFTPAASEFPITLNEIWVQFGGYSPVNGDIELFIHEDTDLDGNPGTGSTLISKYSGQVQANNFTWSKYELSPTVTLDGPGDVLIGVVNRYASASETDYPAILDITNSQGRSWVGTYTSGLVPTDPAYPADDLWGTIDSFGLPGNWMIRAFGYQSCANAADISWLSASLSSGQLGPGEVQMVELSLDSTGLSEGNYYANLCITSNDLTDPIITVPLTMTVVPPPQEPIANDDSYTGQQNEVLQVSAPGVLDNDVSQGGSLTAVLQDPTANGAVDLLSDGSFIYTPTLNFSGTDTFTYYATDAISNSNTAVVTLTVLAQNQPPVALSDSYTTTEDIPLIVDPPGVLANDSDPEDDDLTALLDSGPSYGALDLSLDGSFIYTPTLNLSGVDNFSYHAHDGEEDSNTVVVTITITAANDPPEAVADSYSTQEDNPLTVTLPGVLENDDDVDGDDLTAVLDDGPASGALALEPSGGFVYTPTANFNGLDTFTYHAHDVEAGSNTVSVVITVTAVNDAPVAFVDAYTLTMNVPLAVAAPGLLENDDDVDGDGLSAVLQDPTANGTVDLSPDGSFVYTPTLNFSGTDTFSYFATDAISQSNTAGVTLTVLASNQPPIAAPDVYTTTEDSPLVVIAPGVLTNDSDPEDDDLTALLDNGPSYGALELSPNGSFIYTPTLNLSGQDSFSYHAYDGAEGSDTVVVTLTITAVNDAPVALADSYSTQEDNTLTISLPGVLENDDDVDDDDLTAFLDEKPQHGILSLSPSGAFIYTPTLHFNGSDSFTYRADDGLTLSDPVTVALTVTAVNDLPLARNDIYTTTAGSTLVVLVPGLLANDDDVDGDDMTVELAADPLHGDLNLNEDGSFSYEPDAGYSGIDSFNYQAYDGLAYSQKAIVTLIVEPNPFKYLYLPLLHRP